MSHCIRCYVSGRVQGVFYRASTQQQAEKLEIAGYAKNLPDHRVEVLACGNDNALRALKSWLWQGPRHAEVTDIECEPVDPDPDPYPQLFTTR